MGAQDKNKSFGVVRSFFSFILLGVSVFAGAQPKLHFREDGTFKVLQITDSHFANDNSEYAGYCELVFNKTSRLIKAERPDLIVFTGDIVLRGDVVGLWNRLVDSLSTYKIPYCYCYGNHDTEFEASRTDVTPLVGASPYSLVKANRKGEVADQRVDVLGRNGKPAFCFYVMDSHSYSQDERIQGYAWFTLDQVEWFRRDAAKVTKKNHGEPVPSFMFYHIPVPEYNYKSIPEQDRLMGRRGEPECIQKLNTGMFAAALEQRNIVGMSVGHDHDNDYIATKAGIALCYGRFSGDKTIYHHVVPGARVFVFKENSREFETWIRLETGEVLDYVVFKGEK